MLFVLLSTKCTYKRAADSNLDDPIYESRDWIDGRQLFYDKCGACHIPSDKEVEFSTVRNPSGLQLRKEVIYNTDAHSKALLENISGEEMDKIIVFIKTPPKRGWVE